jgi:hypothetical protein
VLACCVGVGSDAEQAGGSILILISAILCAVQDGKDGNFVCCLVDFIHDDVW